MAKLCHLIVLGHKRELGLFEESESQEQYVGPDNGEDVQDLNLYPELESDELDRAFYDRSQLTGVYEETQRSEL